MTQVHGSHELFVVSENCLVVTNYLEICLYHIPELETIGEDAILDPVWAWSLGASELHGALYKTASPYPALWLQGEQTTHTIEFGVDESGRYPVIVNHHIVEGRSAFYVRGGHNRLQGRKGMSMTEERGEIVFNTGTLGKPDTRRLRAQIPCLNDGPRPTQKEIKYTGLDEMTGRIMVTVGPHGTHCARQLYIADLPP
jgi:hypothetical protein